jgi:uncharacterized secreted protein with C-terminal beta-propeller domain
MLDAGAVCLVADSFVVPQNGPAETLDLLSNDEFNGTYEGPREITAVSFGSEGGRVRISEDRKSVQYTPPADFAGEENFTYFVDTAFSSVVTIEVLGLVADDSFRFVADGQPHELDVLENDPFLANYDGPRKITILSETSAGGELVLAADARSVIYTMPVGVHGKDTFVYIVDDRYPARVTIEIPSPLESDRGEVVQNAGATVFDVLRNDPLWSGYSGERRITHAFGATDESQVVVVDDGRKISFTPGPDFHGYQGLRYVVDGRFESQLAMTVHRPTRDDYATVDAGSSEFFINLTRNDEYRSIDRTVRDVVNRVTSVGDSEVGAVVSITADGQGILYTPPAGFVGSDVVTYVADGKYPATLRVSVTEPVRDDFLQVYRDTIDNSLDVLRNDFHGNGYPGPRLITSVGDTSAGGTVAIAPDGATLIYTPPSEFTGSSTSDSFDYEVDEQFSANVRVYVSPIVTSDYYRFASPEERRLDVLENDHFSPNYLGAAVITAVSEPTNGGSVTIIDAGRALLYSPGADGDQFTYTVDDKHEAAVTIVYPNRLAADETTVDQNSSATEINVLANDFQYRWIQREWGEYTGPRLITAVSETESGGIAAISANGKTIVYTPAADFHGNDRFSYTVDGFLVTSVTLHVIRRVRDDQFHVDPGSADNSLPVLINDLFAANYSGAGRITGVTETAAGGQVTVSPDGQSVLYSPPAGFAGEDSFVYTVDEQLKAEAEVLVHASLDDRFVRFGALDEFKQFLIDDALTRYEFLFGEPGYPNYWDDSGQVEVAPGAGPGRVHSETNVQVAGVDEADIVETDGDYLYTLHGERLVITKAWPADQLELLSSTPVAGTPIGQYLNGDRLAVVSRVWEYLIDPPLPEPDGFAPGGIDDGRILPPFPPRSASTIVTIFDVTDRVAPKVVQQTELDGNYIESRRIDDHVFLVLNNGTASLPQPETTCEEDQCLFETREEYLARTLVNFESILAETLPQYFSLGPDGSLVRSGLLVQPEDIFEPLIADSHNLLSVISVNMANSEPGLSGSSGILTSGATNIYGSLGHLYVFQDQTRWDTEDGSTVEILKFAWDSTTGSVTPISAGTVPGQMVDQFSADEYQGRLRIATTVTNNYSGNYTRRSENLVFVLEDDQGVLEFSGSLRNLALDETIRSVRFFGEQAFVVTFQDIDPLFGIDLSDPSDPQAVGHLPLPGLSEYIQFVGPDRLLTVGRNTPTGFSGPVMVSLFNVAELAEPVLIDQFTLPRFSRSEANVDHHAFGWFAPEQVLSVPSARAYQVRVDRDGDGYRESSEYVSEHELYAFRIDTDHSVRSDDGIELLGTIEHDSPVRRGVYIEDKIYSVADTSIRAADVDDPSIVLSEVMIGTGAPRPPLPVPGTPVWQRLNRFQEMARAELADRLGTAVGSIMTVTSEANIVSENNFRMVLRAADRYFEYETVGEEVVVGNEQYAFAGPRTPLEWHNEANPYDVSGDGVVASGDVRLIVNDLNRSGSRLLPSESVLRQIDHSRFYIDVSGDGRSTAIDALRIINFLNRGEAEGEGGAPTPLLRTEDVSVKSSREIQSVDLIMADQELVGSALLFDDESITEVARLPQEEFSLLEYDDLASL